MAHVDAPVEVRPRRKRPKKLPRHPYDRRKQLGRRITVLAEAFTAKLGQAEVAADPVLASSVERAARLVAYSEVLSAKALRGDPGTSPDDLVRCSRLADQAVRRLNLERHRKPEGPLLSELVNGDRAP